MDGATFPTLTSEYYATFGTYVAPRLAEPMNLTRWEEMGEAVSKGRL
jgi:hypothetical protein